MNALADQHGFLVIYPAQAANANGSRCWNWFRPEDQIRDSGEPSLIAGITREVASAYRVDARRTFVAGMSAGASMAVILGAMYPELYFAVGAHSGLPYGAAHDMPSAFSAMQGGAVLPGRFQPPSAAPPDRAQAPSSTPTIVFHGDNDRTVNARNADAIVEQVTVAGSDRQPLRANVQTGTAPGGRRYRRTDYLDHANQTVVEHWMVHGAGHAWSGGSPNGSFTDPAGPDASAEMVRFFFSRRPELDRRQ
jgi:poly(hydroxyalkanoate) depolymerase family esterase